MSNEKLYPEKVLDMSNFPVPDFFESFEPLQLDKVIEWMNNFENYFIMVDQINGTNQIHMKQLVKITDQTQVTGQRLTFSLPGRLSEGDETLWITRAIEEAGWSRAGITHHGYGCTTYSRFHLTRLFDRSMEKL